MRYWHKPTGRTKRAKRITALEAAFLGLEWHEQNDTTCACKKTGSFITEQGNPVCFDCAHAAARFAEQYALKIDDSYATARAMLNAVEVNA